MQRAKLTTDGRLTIPVTVRRRWQTRVIGLEDLGDRLVIRRLPEDPIAAARGAFRGLTDSTKLRAIAREDEAAAERRRRLG
jgi:bifunctional DNA-binding transcriptional regulator/antitoxin component of YhaV-PrlF toxin-antitoxin module